MRAATLTILLLIAGMPHITCAGEPVVLVTSAYEPYVAQEDTGASGIFPDVVRAAFGELKVEVEFEFLPWKRGESYVKRGDAFAAFPYLITAQRAADHEFSDPVIGFFPRFFYKRDRFPNGFEWTDLEDLGAYRVGGVMGYWYNRSFQEAGLNVSYATTDMQSIRMLMKDRIHFTLIDELVGWALIEEAFPKERSAFSVAQKPESTDPFHLLISREYPDAKELTQQFNQGLKAIKESGIYQGILKQYDVPSEYAISQ